MSTILYLGISVKRAGDLAVSDTCCPITIGFIIRKTVTIFLFLSGIFLTNIDYLTKLDPIKDCITIISIILTILFNFIMFIAIFSHQESCIGNFQYKCKKALASTVLTVVDLEEVSEQYKLLKLGIELVAFFSITFCQTAITLTIFFLVKDHRKWTIGLGTSGLILLVYDLVESFEGVYELVAKVAAKGKGLCFQRMSILPCPYIN